MSQEHSVQREQVQVDTVALHSRVAAPGSHQEDQPQVGFVPQRPSGTDGARQRHRLRPLTMQPGRVVALGHGQPREAGSLGPGWRSLVHLAKKPVLPQELVEPFDFLFLLQKQTDIGAGSEPLKGCDKELVSPAQGHRYEWELHSLWIQAAEATAGVRWGPQAAAGPQAAQGRVTS